MCATRRVLKNRPRLRKTDAREPFDELVDRRTVFEILKECRYRYARATKKPGAAVALSIVLNSITGRPINHDESIALGGKLVWFQTGPRMEERRLTISVYLPQSAGRRQREVHRRQTNLVGVNHAVETLERRSILRIEIFKLC